VIVLDTSGLLAALDAAAKQHRSARAAMEGDIGLTDASLVVIAARYRTSTILTLDERHFRAIRPLDGNAFTLLPTDSPAPWRNGEHAQAATEPSDRCLDSWTSRARCSAASWLLRRLSVSARRC
jgi:hypothetical protein